MPEGESEQNYDNTLTHDFIWEINHRWDASWQHFLVSSSSVGLLCCFLSCFFSELDNIWTERAIISSVSVWSCKDDDRWEELCKDTHTHKLHCSLTKLSEKNISLDTWRCSDDDQWPLQERKRKILALPGWLSSSNSYDFVWLMKAKLSSRQSTGISPSNLPQCCCCTWCHHTHKKMIVEQHLPAVIPTIMIR